jgi:hypothetical protein
MVVSGVILAVSLGLLAVGARARAVLPAVVGVGAAAASAWGLVEAGPAVAVAAGGFDVIAAILLVIGASIWRALGDDRAGAGPGA